MSTRVVVSIGTYHLPFDRLVDWVDGWARPSSVELLVQHGVSCPARTGDNVTMLPHPELLRTYDEAGVLVLQGGAGGVMDALAVGHVPIVVPRLPHLDEVIDHHQVQFGRLLARDGLVHLAESEEGLHRLLDDAVAGRLTLRRSEGFRSLGAGAVIGHLHRLAAGEPPARERRWGQVLSRGTWVGRDLLPLGQRRAR